MADDLHNLTVSLTLLRQVADEKDFHKRIQVYNNLAFFYLLKTMYVNSGINPTNSKISNLSKSTGVSYNTVKRVIKQLTIGNCIQHDKHGSIKLLSVHTIKHLKHCKQFITVQLRKSMTLKQVVDILRFAYIEHSTNRQDYKIKEKLKASARGDNQNILPVDETLSLSVNTMSNFFNCHRRTISRYKKKWVNLKLVLFHKRVQFITYCSKQEFLNIKPTASMFITKRGCVLNRLCDSITYTY